MSPSKPSQMELAIQREEQRINMLDQQVLVINDLKSQNAILRRERETLAEGFKVLYHTLMHEHEEGTT